MVKRTIAIILGITVVALATLAYVSYKALKNRPAPSHGVSYTSQNAEWTLSSGAKRENPFKKSFLTIEGHNKADVLESIKAYRNRVELTVDGGISSSIISAIPTNNKLRTIRLIQSARSNDSDYIVDSSSFAEYSQLQQLEAFSIEGVISFDDYAVSQILGRTHVKHLLIDQCAIDGSGFSNTRSLLTLKAITMKSSSNALSELSWLGKCSELEVVHFENIAINPGELRHITGCQSLREIVFIDCDLPPEDLCHILSCRNVKDLFIAGPEIDIAFANDALSQLPLKWFVVDRIIESPDYSTADLRSKFPGVEIREIGESRNGGGADSDIIIIE